MTTCTFPDLSLQLCGEKEILGQVKLSFIDVEGHKLTANRNLLLTVSRTSRSLKKLEQTLRGRFNGVDRVISSKTAEIDELMTTHLGVSKAVLENVIFCHQDQSLWPMSAPLDLKAKFDAIFEAVKYTKAVNNIKDIRKAQVESLKVLKALEISSKSDKDKGAKVRLQYNIVCVLFF